MFFTPYTHDTGPYIEIKNNYHQWVWDFNGSKWYWKPLRESSEWGDNDIEFAWFKLSKESIFPEVWESDDPRIIQIKYNIWFARIALIQIAAKQFDDKIIHYIINFI